MMSAGWGTKNWEEGDEPEMDQPEREEGEKPWSLEAKVGGRSKAFVVFFFLTALQEVTPKGTRLDVGLRERENYRGKLRH